MVQGFLAGSMKRQEQLKYVRDFLNQIDNIRIVSSWIDYDGDPCGALNQLANNTVDMRNARFLVLDLFEESTTGGRYFEAGYFFAKNLPIYAVGPRNGGYIDPYFMNCFECYRDVVKHLKLVKQGRSDPIGAGPGLENRGT